MEANILNSEVVMRNISHQTNTSAAASWLPHAHAHTPTFGESLRSLFYLLTPHESKFKAVNLVPNYTDSALTTFITLILLEISISAYKRKVTYRVNDCITSFAAGICSRLIRLVTMRAIDISMYMYVYEKWRLVDLPWDSNWTWVVGFIGMDFLYYWFHRAAHEINILWAAHQTHHSSEDYNLSTALRQSIFQGFASMFFYLPNALLVPPSIHLLHLEINILFQFWIHTQFIDSLGPLEYILNTPSHHRVHHGRNPYCIDKNYAGTLIIWDRIFGTFAAERQEVEIAYGLVHPLSSFNPFYVQLAVYWAILKRVCATEGMWNKVCVLMKGPGWEPGKPWTGNVDDIPQVENPIQKYDNSVPAWVSVYASVHYLAMIPVYDQLMLLRWEVLGNLVLLDIIFILFSLTCIGMLFDKKWYAIPVELTRCLLSSSLLLIFRGHLSLPHLLPLALEHGLQLLFLLSSLLFLLLLCSGRGAKLKQA